MGHNRRKLLAKPILWSPILKCTTSAHPTSSCGRVFLFCTQEKTVRSLFWLSPDWWDFSYAPQLWKMNVLNVSFRYGHIKLTKKYLLITRRPTRERCRAQPIAIRERCSLTHSVSSKEDVEWIMLTLCYVWFLLLPSHLKMGLVVAGKRAEILVR